MAIDESALFELSEALKVTDVAATWTSKSTRRGGFSLPQSQGGQVPDRSRKSPVIDLVPRSPTH